MRKTSNLVPSSTDELGTRISEISKLVGGKKKLAHMAGMSESQLYRCINGSSSPTVKLLVAMAKAANVSISWLATGEGEPHPVKTERDAQMDHALEFLGDEEAVTRNQARDQQNREQLSERMKLVRDLVTSALKGRDISKGCAEALITAAYRMPDQALIDELADLILADSQVDPHAAPRSTFEEEFALVSRKDIEVSAGHGAWTEDENHRDFLAFRKTWLNQQGFKVEDLVAVVVRGDSMEPTLSEGDTVLVHTTETRVTDGIYVIRIDDDIFVKRLQHRFGGEVEVISDNKEYRSQVLSGQQLQKMCIIGRVVWMGGMI